MADTLKRDLIDTSFVDGEQPDSNKLTSMVRQLKEAITEVGIAIGDLYSQQTFTGSSGGSHPYELSMLPITGTNLSRITGPTGFLNPRHGSGTVQTLSVTFASGRSIATDPPSTYGYSHYNRSQFVLPKPPVMIISSPSSSAVSISMSWSIPLAWTIQAPVGAGYIDATSSGTGKITTRVANLQDLAAQGDYHVAPDGTITLYSPLVQSGGNAEAFTVSYRFTDLSDSYWGATLNVIPDFEQTTPLCTIALVAGTTYSVTLPAIVGRRSVPNLATWIPPNEMFTYDNASAARDPLYAEVAQLPWRLTSNLLPGDEIPAGAIYLYDETAGEILDGITFTYQSSYIVRATGRVLTVGANRYRLIVCGTDIATTLSYLRESYYSHDHSGRFMTPEGILMGNRIRHHDLLNLIDEGDNHTLEPGFAPSTIGPTRNPHPQYLHRYGFCYNSHTDDVANVHNSMLGSLLMAQADQTLGTTTDSLSIYFGGHPSVAPNQCGGRLRYRQSKDRLELTLKGLEIGYIGTGGVPSLDYQFPRLAMPCAPSTTVIYTLLQEYEPGDAGGAKVRVYQTSDSVFGGGYGLVVTVNARYLLGSWYVDPGAASTPTRFEVVGGGFVVSTHGIGAAWVDADWTPSANSCVPFRALGDPSTGTSILLAEDATLGIVNASSAGSNPAAGAATVSNTLYAKNICKAWVNFSLPTPPAVPIIQNSFGVDSVTRSGSGYLVIALTNPMADIFYSPTINFRIPGYLARCVIQDQSNVRVYLYNISTTSDQDLDLFGGVNVFFNVNIFGEQA